MRRSSEERLATVDANVAPMLCMATDYAPDERIARHAHRKHQLVYAVQGVMVVQAPAGQWVVPPTRAIWMPAGTVHSIRCIGAVHMRVTSRAPGGEYLAAVARAHPGRCRDFAAVRGQLA